jgi:hypothetical protein
MPTAGGIGILYITTGPSFVDEAKIAARSAKRAMPDVPITLFTDQPVSGAPFDDVRPIRATTGALDFFRLRTEILCDSPYERTLHLDTDTFVVRDVRELFTLLDHFDIAIAHDTHRVVVPLEDVPDSFPEFNAGVIAYRGDALRQLGPRWLELYDAHAAGVSYDQPWLRQALYESDLRIATLPPEFNFRVHLAGLYNLPVAILHSHASESEHERVARVASDLHPAYWSSYVHYDRQIWGPHGSARKVLDLRPRLSRYRATRGILRLLRR